MGGNRFLSCSRILRGDIYPTLMNIARLTDGIFTFEYLKNNLMGSAGKQDDSGDLDIAVDQNMNISLSKVAETLRNKGIEVDTKGISGGQIQTLMPIIGKNEFVQVDFILGDLEWLKFSHWSPGKDVSPYKGVWLSTMLGVLTKCVPVVRLQYGTDEIARISWYFDLEKGLHKKWKLQLRPNQGASFVDPDFFETNFRRIALKRGVPVEFIIDLENHRETRVGYIANPEEVLRIVFKNNLVKHAEVDTFEKMWMKINEIFTRDEVENIKYRFVEAMSTSSEAKSFTPEIWEKFLNDSES